MEYLKSTNIYIYKMDREADIFLAIQTYLDYICADVAPSQIHRQSDSQIIRLLLSLLSSSYLPLSYAHTAKEGR